MSKQHSLQKDLRSVKLEDALLNTIIEYTKYSIMKLEREVISLIPYLQDLVSCPDPALS